MLQRTEAAGWRAPLSYLPDALLQPRRPLLAILIACLLTFTISIALAVVARMLLPGAEPPEFKMAGPFALFMLVMFAPMVETLIMGAALLLLTAVVRRELAVVLSALGWAAAHSAIAPVWGLVIWWPFLIFSVLFVTWRQRSLALAFAVPAAAHALQNLMPALVIAFGGAPA